MRCIASGLDSACGEFQRAIANSQVTSRWLSSWNNENVKGFILPHLSSIIVGQKAPSWSGWVVSHIGVVLRLEVRDRGFESHDVLYLSNQK